MYVGYEKPSLESLCYGEGYEFASLFASDIYDEAYLAHYGVKGMKWGVRKAIKLVGRRLRRLRKKAKRRMTPKSKKGTTIKAGTKLQRIVGEQNSGRTKGVYSSYKNVDRDLYKGTYGRMQLTEFLKKYNNTTLKEMTLTAKTDIKIPPKATSQKELNNLLKTDKKAVTSLIAAHEKKLKHSPKQNKAYYKALNKKDGKALYKRFNDALSEGPESENGAIIQKFYDNLAKKGYNAIADENDMRLSTFKAKAPIILFDTEKSIGEISYRDLTASEVFKAYDRSIVQKNIRNAVLPKGVGVEDLKPESAASVERYRRQLLKDQQALNPNYTMRDLANDWGRNRLSRSQIRKVSAKMDEGKSHQQAVQETRNLGNIAVDWYMKRKNIPG